MQIILKYTVELRSCKEQQQQSIALRDSWEACGNKLRVSNGVSSLQPWRGKERTIKKGNFQADAQKNSKIKGNSRRGKRNEPRVI